MSLCLTSEELRELTGYVQAKRQIKWLTDNDWKFVIGADCCPKVARSFYEDKYGAAPEKKRKPRFDRLIA